MLFVEEARRMSLCNDKCHKNNLEIRQSSDDDVGSKESTCVVDDVSLMRAGDVYSKCFEFRVGNNILVVCVVGCCYRRERKREGERERERVENNN